MVENILKREENTFVLSKTYGGVGEYVQAFLIAALRDGEWSVSHCNRFLPVKRGHVTLWI
jgi:hypothetical protein